MSSRLAMNTETLQKNFPNVYRDFFAVCQRAASASNSFLWTGEFSGFFGGLTVSQKLPIRSYVGFETTFDNVVTINHEYQTFDVNKQEFVTAIADNRLCDNLKDYLEKISQRNKEFTGLRVHLLTEIPLGHSLGSNGAIAAALALLIAQESNFDTIFSIAREILALSQAGHSSGVSAYMALSNQISPVIFFASGEDYFAKTIDELANLTQAPSWSIDWGLIYCGIQANAEGVIIANNQTINELEADAKKLHRLLSGKRQLNFRKTYVDMLQMTASLTVMAMVDLAKSGANNQTIERLFNSLNEYQNLLHILHVSNGSTDLIYARIHQLANKQLNDVGSGVKISGIGKGGAVLFALPYGTHRTPIVELVDKLREESGRDICLDYASWLDGIRGEKGKIEQDIARGIKSIFIERDSLSVTILRQGVLHQQVMTSERYVSFKSEIDLLLDQTTGKIWIAGTSLTSKELPSQKATVAIMSDLIKRKGFRVSNTHLPDSYGQSRYDLQGKIVMPLIKQVKSITKRDLQLTVRGGMYDEYELILDPSNIVIAVVKQKN